MSGHETALLVVVDSTRVATGMYELGFLSNAAVRGLFFEKSQSSLKSETDGQRG